MKANRLVHGHGGVNHQERQERISYHIHHPCYKVTSGVAPGLSHLETLSIDRHFLTAQTTWRPIDILVAGRPGSVRFVCLAGRNECAVSTSKEMHTALSDFCVATEVSQQKPKNHLQSIRVQLSNYIDASPYSTNTEATEAT